MTLRAFTGACKASPFELSAFVLIVWGDGPSHCYGPSPHYPLSRHISSISARGHAVVHAHILDTHTVVVACQFKQFVRVQTLRCEKCLPLSHFGCRIAPARVLPDLPCTRPA